MSPFFQISEDCIEPHYVEIAASTNRYSRKARRFTERMWSVCAPFLDAGARMRAKKHDFPSVFWELYLTYDLRNVGIQLVTRPQGRKGEGGPDLLAMNPRVWIEAVMPKDGTADDAIGEPIGAAAFDIPLR